MFRRIALLLTVVLWGSNSLLLPTEASAQTALTKAVIESLRNQVRLMPRNQSARSARPSDTMAAGDALATARASMAQLRFNDGSLARLGEQVVFRFVPGTRTFTLSNGTALLLIPPGQGRTGVRTPNAAAGIRGSALFVRYSPETNTTLIGALTNSGIEVFNDTASQRQELKAGTMAVIVNNRIERVYEFDLNTFYQTSELAQGLNLTQTESTASPDAAIALVQSETSEAAEGQLPVTGQDVIETPSFVRLSANPSADFPDVGASVIENMPDSRQANSEPFRDSFNRSTVDVRSALEVGEIRDTQFFNSITGTSGTTGSTGSTGSIGSIGSTGSSSGNNVGCRGQGRGRGCAGHPTTGRGNP
ncbi:MAG TPA: FecR domain-containing protein [Cyanophyceae cyanobacterium]